MIRERSRPSNELITGQPVASEWTTKVFAGDQPVMMVECKAGGTALGESRRERLAGYFGADRPTKFALLTNGTEYRFYTDLLYENMMDEQPFLELHLHDLDPSAVARVAAFGPDVFDVERVRMAAQEEAGVAAMRRAIEAEHREPSDRLVRLLAAAAAPERGALSRSELRLFAGYTKRALDEYVNRGPSPAEPHRAAPRHADGAAPPQ